MHPFIEIHGRFAAGPQQLPEPSLDATRRIEQSGDVVNLAQSLANGLVRLGFRKAPHFDLGFGSESLHGQTYGRAAAGPQRATIVLGPSGWTSRAEPDRSGYEEYQPRPPETGAPDGPPILSSPHYREKKGAARRATMDWIHRSMIAPQGLRPQAPGR